MDKRTKFLTRSILLVGEVQLKTAHALLDHVPIDANKPLELVVREQVKQRGLDANGYYWLRLGEIAEQAWFGGKQFGSDLWHEYAKINIMPEQITTKDGVVRSKWIEGVGGKLTVVSTTLLEKGCFAEYTTLVEVFGAELGVMFSVNPRERNECAQTKFR